MPFSIAKGLARLVPVFAAVLLAGLLNLVPPVMACGAETDCLIGERTYRIRMPEGHDGEKKVGAIFFMHGWRGSAAGVMRNKSLGKAVSDLGLALVAPKSAFEDWAIPGTPSGAEPVELEYFDALIAEVTSKYPIDSSKLVASGFSAGGMMVWNLACDRGDRFAGFVPIAGTFWEPTPTSCSSPPVNLIHIHGTTDKMVPIKGRPIGQTRQGNVNEVLAMYSGDGGYRKERSYTVSGLELACEESTNPERRILELCLHSGGHSMKKGYLIHAWKRLTEIGAIAVD